MDRITTNGEFGDLIGVSRSMASRIRSGQRLPGTQTLYRIHLAYGIPPEELLAAHDEGPEEFSLLIREMLRHSLQEAA